MRKYYLRCPDGWQYWHVELDMPVTLIKSLIRSRASSPKGPRVSKAKGLQLVEVCHTFVLLVLPLLSTQGGGSSKTGMLKRCSIS